MKILFNEKEEDFRLFLKKVDHHFLQHPIVTHNHYTGWFARGEMNLGDLRHFTVQFSVFSNSFLVSQLKKMINAESLEGMRSAKEILANEIGVIFKNPKVEKKAGKKENESEDENENVGTEGSVEGGTFRFNAGHFEWLLRFAEPLGLNFGDLGKRRHGTPSSLFFCDQLDRFYGHEDSQVAAGASFGIENWAAAGFWKQLISGLTHFKNKNLPELPLGFFRWHDQLEAQHAQHTQDELRTLFFRDDFDEDKFLQGGLVILDALAEFWNGLERDRLCGQELAQRITGS